MTALVPGEFGIVESAQYSGPGQADTCGGVLYFDAQTGLFRSVLGVDVEAWTAGRVVAARMTAAHAGGGRDA